MKTKEPSFKPTSFGHIIMVAILGLICAMPGFSQNTIQDLFDYKLNEESKVCTLSKFKENIDIPNKLIIPGEIIINEIVYDNIVVENGAIADNDNITHIVFEAGSDNANLTLFAYSIRNCKSLEIVDLPKTLFSINITVFSECESLETVICRKESVPDVLSPYGFTAEQKVFNNCTLYVKENALDEYEKCKSSTDTNKKNFWGQFKDYQKIDESDDSDDEDEGNKKDEEDESTPLDPKDYLERARQNTYSIEAITITKVKEEYRDLLVGTIIIPSKITENAESDVEHPINIISKECFKDCNKIREIILDSEMPLQALYNRAFADAESLRKIVLPENIKEICMNKEAFEGCPSLRIVVCPGTPTSLSYNGNYTVKEPMLPEVVLYVPKEEIENFNEKSWNKVFGTILPIENAIENVTFKYDGINVEFPDMVKGHRIRFEGCMVEPIEGNYRVENEEITIDSHGGMVIDAQKPVTKTSPRHIMKENESATTLKLGDATLTLPDMAVGHQMVIIVPDNYKFNSEPTDAYDVESKDNVHTITIKDMSNSIDLAVTYNNRSYIESPISEEVNIVVKNGGLEVNGLCDDDTVLITDMQGRTVNYGKIRKISLAPGLYIVSTPYVHYKIKI